MDVFDALADPIRRELLRRLARQPSRVVDLAADHPVSRPAISRHLRILSQAGLVTADDRGRERHYHLEPGPLRAVTELVVELTSQGPPVTDRHLDALETEVRRTTRDRRAVTTRHRVGEPTQERTA